MPGPGRHFYCPIWWERTLVDDVVVQPGELAIVTSKLGDDLPSGQFLVDGDLGETKSKGILRRTFGPGRYRINPYGYECKIVKTEQEDAGNGQIKHSGWVHINPGYVGVVTYLTDNPGPRPKAPGIQNDTLPPGLYPINPREMQIDMISIGYNAEEISTEKMKDAHGTDRLRRERRRAAGSQHRHQLSLERRLQNLHGFQRRLGHHARAGAGHHPPFRQSRRREAEGDYPAMRKHLPQQRLETGRRGTAGRRQPPEIPGRTWTRPSRRFSTRKNISLLYGLVRHIYIPKEVREPIQKGYVADELSLTRTQETTTAKMEANLREAEQTVLLEAARITEGTKKLVAETKATGQKEAETIAAETEKKVAAIDRQVRRDRRPENRGLGRGRKRLQTDAAGSPGAIVRTGRQGVRRSDGLHQVAIRPGLAGRHRFEDDLFRARARCGPT